MEKPEQPSEKQIHRRDVFKGTGIAATALAASAIGAGTAQTAEKQGVRLTTKEQFAKG